MGDRHHTLPPRPNLAWYRKQAKQLQAAVAERDAEALERAREVLGDRVGERFRLADAQHVIAQEHGLRTWADFQAAVRAVSADDRPVGRIGLGDESQYDERAQALQEEIRAGHSDALRRVRAYVPRLDDVPGEALVAAGLERRDARLVVAREYGFRTWRELVAGAREFTASWYAHRRPQGLMAEAVAAIQRGDAELLRSLLAEHPQLVHEIAVRGETLLGTITQPDIYGEHLGRELGVDRACVEVLIEAGSELEGPLGLAACFGRIELMELLLEHGARAAVDDEVHGLTPLATAIYHGQTEAADLLLAHGAQARSLWAAAACGLVAQVESWFAPDGSLLPGAGDPRPNLADVGWPPAPPPRDEEGEILGEALCHAAHNGRDAVVEALLARGVSVDARPYLGLTSLHFAVMAGRLETARMLIARGSDLSLRDEIHGRTPLEWCVQLGRPRLRALLEEAEGR